MATSIFNSFLSYLVIYGMIRNQDREEIFNSTQTLQTREFGEITMARNAFAAGDTPYSHTLLTRCLQHLDPRAFGASVRPCCTVQKNP